MGSYFFPTSGHATSTDINASLFTFCSTTYLPSLNDFANGLRNVLKKELLTFLTLFSFFSNKNFTGKTVDVSGIPTRIVRVEGEHADYLTTTPAVEKRMFYSIVRCNWNMSLQYLYLSLHYPPISDVFDNIKNFSALNKRFNFDIIEK